MRLKDEYQIRPIAGEQIVIIQGEEQTDLTRILSLNPTAVWLWEQLSGKDFSEKDVANLLLDRFEIDSATATADARGWIDSLKHHQILKP